MELEAAIDSAIEVVGLTALKPLQREAVRSFCSGHDVFVSLPTGYGKSYCLFCYRWFLIVYSAVTALSFSVYLLSHL